MPHEQCSLPKSTQPEEFSYCIGRPWSPGSTDICVYAYGTQVHHGTVDDAKSMRDFINKRSGKKYSIYKLVPVEGT